MPTFYLLDTNTVSAIMADDPKVKARLATCSGKVVTCAIVRGEIRFGLKRLPAGKRRADLEGKAAVVFSTLPIEPVTHLAADIYGAIRWSLESLGQNSSDNDLWIAATALSLGAVAVTNDQLFGQVPGLCVEDWTT